MHVTHCPEQGYFYALECPRNCAACSGTNTCNMCAQRHSLYADGNAVLCLR